MKYVRLVWFLNHLARLAWRTRWRDLCGPCWVCLGGNSASERTWSRNPTRSSWPERTRGASASPKDMCGRYWPSIPSSGCTVGHCSHQLVVWCQPGMHSQSYHVNGHISQGLLNKELIWIPEKLKKHPSPVKQHHHLSAVWWMVLHTQSKTHLLWWLLRWPDQHRVGGAEGFLLIAYSFLQGPCWLSSWTLVAAAVGHPWLNHGPWSAVQHQLDWQTGMLWHCCHAGKPAAGLLTCLLVIFSELWERQTVNTSAE